MYCSRTESLYINDAWPSGVLYRCLTCSVTFLERRNEDNYNTTSDKYCSLVLILSIADTEEEIDQHLTRSFAMRVTEGSIKKEHSFWLLIHLTEVNKSNSVVFIKLNIQTALLLTLLIYTLHGILY